MLPGFELGDTVQLTFVSSVAPDAAPTLSIADAAGTVVQSGASVSSDSTHYYGLFTIPDSGRQYFVATWTALKTFNSSAYQFQKRMGFLGVETLVET